MDLEQRFVGERVVLFAQLFRIDLHGSFPRTAWFSLSRLIRAILKMTVCPKSGENDPSPPRPHDDGQSPLDAYLRREYGQALDVRMVALIVGDQGYLIVECAGRNPGVGGLSGTPPSLRCESHLGP